MARFKRTFQLSHRIGKLYQPIVLPSHIIRVFLMLDYHLQETDSISLFIVRFVLNKFKLLKEVLELVFPTNPILAHTRLKVLFFELELPDNHFLIRVKCFNPNIVLAFIVQYEVWIENINFPSFKLLFDDLLLWGFWLDVSLVGMRIAIVATTGLVVAVEIVSVLSVVEFLF